MQIQIHRFSIEKHQHKTYNQQPNVIGIQSNGNKCNRVAS